MIDFHYSDTWADPGHQTKPAAWANYTFAQLTQAVYDHTYDVLNTLKTNGVDPEWTQVGNETNDGMLWEDGRASASMKNFAPLITSGYKAVKAVNPAIKVVVHISNGYDNSLFRWMFDGLKSNSATWDVIGMSLYPDQSATASSWQTYDTECLANMNDMVSRYGKEVVLSEIGMNWSDAQTAYDFIVDIIKKTKSVSGGNGIGVFYWEPESYNGWNGYQKGAFDNSGKPTIAMNAFQNEAVTAIMDDAMSENQITFFPNPFSSSIKLSVPGTFDYALYDAEGKLLKTGRAVDRTEIGADLPHGFYFIMIKIGEKLTRFKIAKE